LVLGPISLINHEHLLTANITLNCCRDRSVLLCLQKWIKWQKSYSNWTISFWFKM